MKLKIFQKGFNYSQDGEGNRLIIHLQGCNMKCPWCSNPEGMPLEGVLFVEKEWLKESGKVVHLDCDFMDELKEHLYRDHGFRLQCSGDMLHGICQDCEKKETP